MSRAIDIENVLGGGDHELLTFFDKATTAILLRVGVLSLDTVEFLDAEYLIEKENIKPPASTSLRKGIKEAREL